MIPSLEGWPTKAPSLHEVRLTLLDTNPVFQCLWGHWSILYKMPFWITRPVPHKLDALRWIRKYLTSDKAKLLGNAFTDSQFNYPPLIWMFYHETTYLKMQKNLSIWGLLWWSTAIKQQCVPSPTTLAVFIYGNIQKYWYIKYAILWSTFFFEACPGMPFYGVRRACNLKSMSFWEALQARKYAWFTEHASMTFSRLAWNTQHYLMEYLLILCH